MNIYINVYIKVDVVGKIINKSLMKSFGFLIHTNFLTMIIISLFFVAKRCLPV